MATKNIIINDYTVPVGVNKKSVRETIIKFNNNTISSFANKYIGTDKICNREMIKRISSGVEGVTYTIRFSIKKSTATASVSYELIAHDMNIIESNQGYKVTNTFNTDMEFINNAILNIFKD